MGTMSEDVRDGRLRSLLVLLRELGVSSFKSDGFEVTFAPLVTALPAKDPEAKPSPDEVPAPRTILDAMGFPGLTDGS